MSVPKINSGGFEYQSRCFAVNYATTKVRLWQLMEEAAMSKIVIQQKPTMSSLSKKVIPHLRSIAAIKMNTHITI